MINQHGLAVCRLPTDLPICRKLSKSESTNPFPFRNRGVGGSFAYFFLYFLTPPPPKKKTLALSLFVNRYLSICIYIATAIVLLLHRLVLSRFLHWHGVSVCPKNYMDGSTSPPIRNRTFLGTVKMPSGKRP